MHNIGGKCRGTEKACCKTIARTETCCKTIARTEASGKTR
jgi:hypothetical protein